MIDLYVLLVYIVSYIGLIVISFYCINVFKSRRRGDKYNESTDKLISVIIPAYNEEDAVERTLDSALKIDYPKDKIEIIFVDDGSKDKTLELAEKYKLNGVKVFHKENGGKGSALNFGIKKAKGEIIFSMDADSFVKPDAVKKMVALFKNPEVMSVTPSMLVYKPKTIWQKVQYLEYYLGVFLRKAFSTLNAVHITPGAFSAYRKCFFERYGGYDENNITEDMEIALRVQSEDYIIENNPYAVVFTNSPRTFKELLAQRKRWYVGLMKNLCKYKTKLFNRDKGALGLVVLPMAIISMVSSTILTSYILLRGLTNLKRKIVLLQSVNFSFSGLFEFNRYIFENTIMNILSQKVFLLAIFFLFLLGFYGYYAFKKTYSKENVFICTLLFLIFYSPLFVFWIFISLAYFILDKPVKWRDENVKKQA